MGFLQLTGGAYQARSLIAAAQRCLNLYPEQTPSDIGEVFPATHYCTPGLTFVANSGQERCRGLYTAYDGTLYAVYNQTVYLVDQDEQMHSLGTIQGSDPSDATARDTPVSMCDNGAVLLIADGSLDGYFVDLSKKPGDRTLTRIDRNVNPGWLGSDHVAYQDTFFLCNKPDSAQFYISLTNIDATNLTSAFSAFYSELVTAGSRYVVNDVLDLTGTGGAQITVNAVDANGAITAFGTTNGGAINAKPANPIATTGGNGSGATFNVTWQTNIGAFDSLDFAAMTGQANKVVAVTSMHRNVWVIGSNSFEVWINTGGEGSVAGSFPLIIYQDAFGPWGCIAKYSVVSVMNQIFWLSADKFGKGMVMRAEALTAKRISTHAIEQAISTYDRIDDAIGMSYQQGGHSFYLLTFPSARDSKGATWCFDASTNLWHERCWIDNNGVEYRHVANAISAAYDHVYVGDWRNGNLYRFDLDNYTDNGQPIKRLRSFPHQVDLESSRRVFYQQLIAQMQVGSAPESAMSSNVASTDFSGPDGTLLENFGGFTRITGEGEIINDAVVQSSATAMLYQVTAIPTSPNYSVTFTMTPTSYFGQPPAGQSLYAIGRADGSNNGYKVAISSDGTNYNLVFTIMPLTVQQVTLGTLSGGSYRVIMVMKGSEIDVYVQRTLDGLWYATGWGSVMQPAIIVNDGTYVTPGKVLMGAG